MLPVWICCLKMQIMLYPCEHNEIFKNTYWILIQKDLVSGYLHWVRESKYKGQTWQKVLIEHDIYSWVWIGPPCPLGLCLQLELDFDLSLCGHHTKSAPSPLFCLQNNKVIKGKEKNVFIWIWVFKNCFGVNEHQLRECRESN